MTFDSNQAWKQATAAIAANREVLYALAGVFFLVPALALALFAPQPEPAPGATPDAMMAQMQEYYVQTLPWLIPALLLQAGGTLAMLTLFTDRSRPTVGEAIRLGFGGVASYVAAQLLVGLAVGLVGGVLIAVGALAGPAGAVMAIVGIAALVFWLFVRTSLSAPVVAVEGVRNPVVALRRSWMLTRGNGGRIALFYLLVGIAFLLVMIVVMAVVGIVLALVAGGETARVLVAVVSSALGSVVTLYFAGILAAVHRQMAGPSTEALGSTFD